MARNRPDPSTRLATWKLLFERGYGKAVTPGAVNIGGATELRGDGAAAGIVGRGQGGGVRAAPDDAPASEAVTEPALGAYGARPPGPHAEAERRLRPGRQQGQTLTPQPALRDPLATEFPIPAPGSFEDFVAQEGRRRFRHHVAALKEPSND